jgi:hypothetical protein
MVFDQPVQHHTGAHRIARKHVLEDRDDQKDATSNDGWGIGDEQEMGVDEPPISGVPAGT